MKRYLIEYRNYDYYMFWSAKENTFDYIGMAHFYKSLPSAKRAVERIRAMEFGIKQHLKIVEVEV